MPRRTIRAMRLQVLATTLLVALIAPPPINANGGWNDPTSDQFHIQTDEGPERYFRYQTQSGQYRKEKRLEDGTVVGSYGWIDSNGILRLRDYIADNAGYRILRTKDVFVGRNRPISQAIKASKKVPSSAGILTNPNEYLPPKTTYISSTSPRVDISHNSFPSSTLAPPPYSSTELPPLFASTTASPIPTHTPSPIYPSSTPYYVPSSTPATVVISQKPPTPTPIYSSTPAPVFIAHSSTPNYQSYPSSTIYLPPPKPTTYQPRYPSSTIAPQINSNSIDYYENQENPYIRHNGPTYPIDRHGNVFLGYNQIGNGYDPQYPQYDGVSVTNDGFRYYIPRAYHEEQNVRPDTKTGSFGYIDPFGIRRVVYYNAGPGGFQHKKNNRYVGFDATPYDPRPY